MYEIIVESHFDVAHFLRGYRGKCENLHGHRYIIKVRLKTDVLNEIGLAYDFTEVKKRLNVITEKYDHFSLNDIPPFDKINPSAENVAAVIFRDLKASLAGEPIKLSAVEAWETPQQGIVYTED